MLTPRYPRFGPIRAAALIVLVASLLPACSSAPSPATTAAPASPPVSNRLYEMITGRPTPPTAGQTAAVPGPDDYPCPDVAIREGAGSLQVMAKGGLGPTDVRHQLSLVYTARECVVSVGLMTIKVGIQGRAVLGPRGAPGPLDAPLRYAVVHEGDQPRTVITKFIKAPVNVPPGNGNVPFTNVYELTFPLPTVADLRAYIVYVGFDPQGK
jgi:hypothetical protein